MALAPACRAREALALLSLRMCYIPSLPAPPVGPTAEAAFACAKPVFCRKGRHNWEVSKPRAIREVTARLQWKSQCALAMEMVGSSFVRCCDDLMLMLFLIYKILESIVL